MTELSPAARSAITVGLVALLEKISEESFAAGWMSDLEYSLWELMSRDGPQSYGQSILTAETLAVLRELSVLIDGWVTYREYVPMAQWLDMVAAYRPDHA